MVSKRKLPSRAFESDFKCVSREHSNVFLENKNPIMGQLCLYIYTTAESENERYKCQIIAPLTFT